MRKYDYRPQFKASKKYPGGFDVYNVAGDKIGEVYPTPSRIEGLPSWKLIPAEIEVAEAFAGIDEVAFPDKFTCAKCLEALHDGEPDIFRATMARFSLDAKHLIERIEQFATAIDRVEGANDEGDVLRLAEFNDALRVALTTFDPQRMNPANRKNNKGKRGRRYRN